jgi:WD40 repeat protein
MHTAVIKRVDVDAAGRRLVTASEDGTARVWELPSGRLEQIMRPPHREGIEGKLFAVAVCPMEQFSLRWLDAVNTGKNAKAPEGNTVYILDAPRAA